MSLFKGRRIMRKLTIAMMLTSGIALLLAFTAFVTNDFLQLRRIFRRELATTGNIVAAGSATALSVQDHAAVKQAIQVLRGDESIVAAAFYLRNGKKPFASYYRDGAEGAALPAAGQPGMYTDRGSMVLIQSVVLNGAAVGTLAIRADTSAMSALLVRDLRMAAMAMLTCILIAFVSTSRLRQNIAKPIASLAEAVGKVSRQGEPARIRGTDDEVNVLTDAFGVMCTQADHQVAALEACRALLEDETAERTAALERSNLELLAAKNHAVEAARLKGEYLANMSHEIRTPMNDVIVMAQMALETDLSPEQRQYVASAGISAERLLGVINNIIDFSRLEGGGVILEKEEFSVSETLYEVMRRFSPAARQKGLALLLDVHGDVPSTVMGDHARFRQIIVNLIENAIKFTEIGTVTAGVSLVFHSDRVVGLHFEVKDTGSGLAKDRFERAVEPFAQPRNSSMQLTSDTGLGLAISNRLIGMMGGCLWLDTNASAGSTFHFTTTFELPNRLLALALDLNDLRGASVLVADANPITRRILQQLLARWYMRPTLAASWLEATDLMREAMTAGSPFDIALIDRHMLGLNGQDVAKEVAEHPELGNPVIMALSSMSAVSVTDLTREFSAANYLVKPVTHAALLKAISGAMHERTTAAPHKTQVSSNRVLHILVADDNLTNQIVAVSILRKEGYEVSIAKNGIETIAAYDRGGLDMILMDIQMPDMSGIDATRLIRLKEAASGTHIPILALTAHAMPGDREQCLEAGMDDYMSKPFQVRALRTAVRQLLVS